MSPDDLREILFDLFPRKVSTDADEAEGIVRELRTFWTFLQREFNLANAEACLKVLDEKAARQLKKELSNPANFGIAKSFMMMGLERGFDLSSERGSTGGWKRTIPNWRPGRACAFLCPANGARAPGSSRTG